ncbi:MAG: hypothetical protein Q8N60_03825 [Candidatus Diapherotrites archaeon]|nr:hypothetical protein [Candidatus Diapherotrites archaeon]
MALPLSTQKIGSYAFIVGVVIAVLAGIAGGFVAEYAGGIALALVILGLIVGYLNISDKEIVTFVVASIGLIVAGSANLKAIDTVVVGLGTVLQAILANIVVFIAPAVIVVGLKAVYSLAKTAEAGKK